MAVVGAPNAGKSTLTNALVGRLVRFSRGWRYGTMVASLTRNDSIIDATLRQNARCAAVGCLGSVVPVTLA